MRYYINSYPASVVNFSDSFLGIDPNNFVSDCNENNCANYYLNLSKQQCPEFLNWTSDAESRWNACYDEFLSTVLSSGTMAREKWPLFYNNYFVQMKKFHDRKIKPPCSGRVTCCCIPGAVRLYCDIYGNYFPCERVELRDSFKIGDVWSGLDANKVSIMVNYMSEVTQCGSCVGKHLCSICPAMITGTNANSYSDIRIQQHCRKISEDLSNQLMQYVSSIEIQPGIFPDSDSNQEELDWISNVYFITRT
jgi:hypothetical protein